MAAMPPLDLKIRADSTEADRAISRLQKRIDRAMLSITLKLIGIGIVTGIAISVSYYLMDSVLFR